MSTTLGGRGQSYGTWFLRLEEPLPTIDKTREWTDGGIRIDCDGRWGCSQTDNIGGEGEGWPIRIVDERVASNQSCVWWSAVGTPEIDQRCETNPIILKTKDATLVPFIRGI
ncbi:hypothetical protein AVEN_185561-1 [Araneus ventricosus]|uniref:Uncharacterized protein n=1 Tax=Araneus ventricosus TaxID=182803 RepID=A0A4Y2HD08_ARAVE|nr:hypothetical protein AVEN_185561-1 [Araneus ventricosus]